MNRAPNDWWAIAAMSENRVIGQDGQIPWRLPEDFRFFRETTTGHTLVMGRRTFESIGRPLPGRHTLVLTRHGLNPPPASSREPAAPAARTSPPGTFETIDSPESIEARRGPGRLFICGGSQIYEQLLPRCAGLYLTRVKRTVAGDALFPPFESAFQLAEIVRDTTEFAIERWIRRTTP